MHDARLITAAPSGPGFVRNLRLTTGVILFVNVLTHLLNHALGLVWLSALEAGQWWFKAFWRHPLATTALYGALVVHLALALASLYRRHHLRMPAWEATQMALGLVIPVLLFSHVIGTRLARRRRHPLRDLRQQEIRRPLPLGVFELHALAGVHELVRFLLTAKTSLSRRRIRTSTIDRR